MKEAQYFSHDQTPDRLQGLKAYSSHIHQFLIAVPYLSSDLAGYARLSNKLRSDWSHHTFLILKDHIKSRMKFRLDND